MSLSVIKFLSQHQLHLQDQPKDSSACGRMWKRQWAGATEPFLKSSWFPRYLWAFFHCTSLQFLNFSLRRYVHRTHRDFKLQQSRWCTWSSRLSKVAACATEIPISRSAVPYVLLNKTTGSQKGPRNENIRGTHEGSLCKAWDCSSSWLWHRDFPQPRLEHLWNYVQRFYTSISSFLRSRSTISLKVDLYPQKHYLLSLMVYLLENLQYL